MQTKISIVLILLVAASLLQLNGCTLIGLSIGSGIEYPKDECLLIPGWKVGAITPGDEIHLMLNDGEQVSGKYLGINPVPQERYAEMYAKFRKEKSEELILPELGENITIVMKSGIQAERELVGFYHQYLATELQEEKDSVLALASYMMSVRRLQEKTTGPVRLTKVDRVISSRGDIVEGESLQKLAKSGEIPFLFAVTIEGLMGATQVPMNEIYRIQVPKKGSYWLAGLAVGLTMDVLVVVYFLATFDPLEGAELEPTDGSSCPFVYSFDGGRYVRDSEPYGGAIYKAAQRTDRDNLDHLTEIQGSTRLKIANELPETQYIDEVKLLVVDHPRGTKVVPSFPGKLHTLSAPRPPTKAVDFRDCDVLELVKSKDDQLWISNPFGRDPGNKADGRDGLALEFARPQGKNFVKLAFNVQNTLWASYLLRQFLELHGDELENTYNLLNSSEEASEALQEAMKREAMLLIKVWNGKTWQTFNGLPVVGAAVAKDQVVWLDIRNVPGEVLRLRLESTVGLWIVNSIQADYTPDLPLEITELSLTQAIDHSGRDLKELLNTIDGRYYEMPTLEDWAELTFKAPSEEEGLERSFILKCTGYYTIHTDAEGEPQRDLIAKLMSEPGAYGQYTLQLLNGYVMSALEQLE